MWKRRLCLLGLSVAIVAISGEYAERKFKGIQFRAYTTEVDKLQLHWKDPNSRKPHTRFKNLRRALVKQGKRPVFMMNAGIYDPGYSPTGLHVEKGKILRPINLKNANGNFYLKPNGVFFVTHDNQPQILESKAYLRSWVKPRLAVQSGPLLLEKGKVHPKFDPNSRSRLHRNGVGILDDSRVAFVCTKRGQPRFPNLHEFASFFRSLGCRDALFLDGDISTMLVKPKGEVNVKNHFAAMLTISEDQ